MGFLATMLVKLGVDPSDLNSGMDRATRSVNKFGQDVASAGKSLAMGLTLPIAGLATAALKASGDMEALRKGLDATTKNSAETSRQLERLKEIAKLPGLGFKEAVQGSINLQQAGFSASLAERSLKAFGNALATVGKGRADLDGVTLALTQIAAKGKVSAEEINQLQERLPQIRKAMKDAFGTADTEALKKMGIDSQVFIEKIVAEFGKLPPAAGGFNNSLENLRDTAFQALSKIGDIVRPWATDFIENRLNPMIERVKEFAERFGRLPKPVQDVALGVTAGAAAFPLLTIAIGQTITNLIVIGGAFGKVLSVAKSLLPVLGAPLGIAAALATVGALAWKAGDYLQNRFGTGADTASESLKRLNEQYKKSDIIKNLSHGGPAAGGIPGFAKDIMDAVNVATGGVKKLVDIDKMLTDSGIKTMAQRRKDLDEAKSLYAAVVKEYGSGSAIAVEALTKLKAAQEALVPSLQQVKEHASGLFQFGTRGLESAVLVESVRRLADERQKFIASIADVGGKDVLFGKAADNVKKAIEELNKAPKPEVLGEMSKGLQDVLDITPQLPPDLQRITTALDAFGLATKNTDIDLLERNLRILGEGVNNNTVSVEQYTRAWLALAKAKDAAGIKLSEAEKKEVIELEKQYGGQIKETRKEMSAYQREADRAFNGVSRGIAKNIVELKGFGQTGINVAKDLATGFLEIMIQQLLDPLKQQFTKLAGHIGNALGKVLGGGGGAGKAASSIIDESGGIANIGGGVGSAASAGIGSITNMVTGAVSAISGVVGNFQMAGMNKSLDVLVNHTLRIFNELAIFRQDAWLRETHLMVKLDDVWNEVRNVVAAVRAGGVSAGGGRGSVSFNNCVFNGTTPEAMMQAAFDQFALAQGS